MTATIAGPSVTTPIGTTPHAAGIAALPVGGAAYAFVLCQAFAGAGAVLSRRAFDGSHGEVVESITSGPAALSAYSLQFYGNTTMIAASHDNVTPKLGFFNAAAVAKQSITGALSTVTDAAAKAVLTAIINALTNFGLTTNSTT